MVKDLLRKSDVWLGIGSCALGVVLYFVVNPTAISAAVSDVWEMGPEVLPNAVAVGLIIVGIMLLLEACFSAHGEGFHRWQSTDKRTMVGVLAGLVAIGTYIQLQFVLGYLEATLLFLIVAFRLLGYARWWRLVATTLGFGVTMQYVFVEIMAAPLPTGFLSSWLAARW